MTNIIRGAIQRTASAYDDFYTGTITVTGSPAQPLTTERTPILEVVVQANPLEQNSVAVGNANGQNFVLTAGDNITIKVNDLSRVFIGVAGGAAAVTANWIAYV